MKLQPSAEFNKCLCNKDLESEEMFIWFIQTSRADANIMLKLIKDYLLTFGLPFSGFEVSFNTGHQIYLAERACELRFDKKS